MATVPTQEQVAEAVNTTASLISEKRELQESIGKSFELPTGGGSGVIPEEVWDTFKGDK